jgi:hypothetical protein
VSDEAVEFGADVLPADDGVVGEAPEPGDGGEAEEEDGPGILAAVGEVPGSISSDWNAEEMFVDALHDAVTAPDTAAERVGAAANGEDPETVEPGDYEFDRELFWWEGEDAVLSPTGPAAELVEDAADALDAAEGESGGAERGDDPLQAYLDAAESGETVAEPSESGREA